MSDLQHDLLIAGSFITVVIFLVLLIGAWG